jgi:hypothetical protein
MAHLLEHMLFKGSTKHTNIMQEVTEHGSQWDGTTSFNRTNYFETFKATDENLKWALDLESDRMVNSFIKKEDFDKEFSVVRNEFDMGENNPMGVLNKHTMATAYIAHSYGRPEAIVESGFQQPSLGRFSSSNGDFRAASSGELRAPSETTFRRGCQALGGIARRRIIQQAITPSPAKPNVEGSGVDVNTNSVTGKLYPPVPVAALKLLLSRAAPSLEVNPSTV